MECSFFSFFFFGGGGREGEGGELGGSAEKIDEKIEQRYTSNANSSRREYENTMI